MIEIKNLNKQYRPSSEEYALKNINFTFDNKGLYAIVGPSGCGKSTFLQILAGLDNDYQGEILINGETIKNIQEYISYSTQKFHHFPFLSYKQNILVNLDSNKSNDVSFYLNELELEGDISSATLSGGELARLVFIRTILSNNSVLLFDEPFSSVNETLAHKMLDILKKIAKEKLIIIVTHQNELMDKLPKIIKMKDGNFLNDIEARSNGRIEKTIHKSKSLFSFILHKMKYTPKRTSAMIAVCSIAMMFSSLTVCLKDSLSDSISNSLKSFCDEDSYVGSIKNDNNVLNNAYAVPLENINYDNKGYYYDCNYEMLFKTMNNVYISTGENKYKINSLSARSFNEFYLLEEDDGLFPQEEYMLKNEEVILGLSKSDLYAFSIYLTGAKHTPYELGEFIKENLILLDVYLGNSEYKYSEEQHFVVKGFKLTNQSCLYHTNPLWNQFIFEEQLGFPFIDSLYGDVESINTLRRYSKITFKNYDEVECFERENNYVLDKVERYSALPFNNSYLCFNSDKGFLPESKIQYLSPFAKFGNQSGYYIFEQTGLSGFANNMFFVKNEDVCDE
ncbi:MAG: ATP-binding cassette domain-containing protein, partial [Bacilli bacterium]|nr:ATP-binding cassette domain-containing protein [Bacilli bacterium]